MRQWVFVRDVWALLLPAGRSRPHRFYAVGFLTLILLAAICEVFDFQPIWGIMDAHATWHTLTAPMVPVWYRFWTKDCEYERAKGRGRKEGMKEGRWELEGGGSRREKIE